MSLVKMNATPKDGFIKVFQLRGSLENGKLNKEERDELISELQSLGIEEQLGWLRFSSDWGFDYDYAVIIGKHKVLMRADEFEKMFNVSDAKLENQFMCLW